MQRACILLPPILRSVRRTCLHAFPIDARTSKRYAEQIEIDGSVFETEEESGNALEGSFSADLDLNESSPEENKLFEQLLIRDFADTNQNLENVKEEKAEAEKSEAEAALDTSRAKAKQRSPRCGSAASHAEPAAPKSEFLGVS